MFAVAVGHLTGLTPDEIRDGLAAFEGVGMRQNITHVDGITYILDYYNASPESIRASLVVTKRLAENQGGRAVAVLGSVLELGEHSEALHRAIGRHAATLPVDLLFTFGADAVYTAEEAVVCGMSPDVVASFPDISDAAPLTDAVRKALHSGDVVLLKASHSIRLERVADELIQPNN
jgi:UDP-N-acetylmuramoyl-tripeptide--D-alanyl-D-alanine ligase